jgi:RHS repeat-associated protein
MLRSRKHSSAARRVALIISVSLLWLLGPYQVGLAANEHLREEAARTAGEARLLNEHQQAAIRGRASNPGKSRNWEYGIPTLGGHGEYNWFGHNHHVEIPVVAVPGKGVALDFRLHHNSAATMMTFPMPRPPIANGWTHSYNVFLQGAGTSTVTVVEGDGTRNSFTQNVDGSFTPPAGVHDTLTLSSGTYTLTRKLGTALHFNGSHKLHQIVDLNGNTTSITYNANGDVWKVSDPSARELVLSYNASNVITTITDPSSRQFTLSYDGSHNLSRVTYPSPAMGQPQPFYEVVMHGTQGTMNSFRDRRGSVWTLAYDTSGDWQRVVKTTDPFANDRTFTDIFTGGLTTLENGVTYLVKSDGSGNRASVELGGNSLFPTETESWTWDAQRNMLTRETGAGNTWEYTYDSRGNTLTVTNPLSITVATLTYTVLNRPETAVDALSNLTTYGYDSGGNLTSVTDPISGLTLYDHNSAGLLIEQTDARAKITTYGYDTYGNMTSLTDPENKVTSFQFNVLSLPTSRTDALNRTTTYGFDNLGRQTSVTFPDNSQHTFSYDSGDLLLSFTDGTGTTTRGYDDLGRMTSEVKGGRTFSYTYDEVGNRESLTDPDSRLFEYERDNAGRLVKLWLNSNLHAEFAYDLDGNLVEQLNPNGSLLYQTWDDAGRLTLLENRRGNNTLLSSFQYTYNNNGLRTGVTEGDGSTVAWGYDGLNRLTSEVRTGTNPFSTSWTLDAVGNWTSRVHNGATTNYSYTDADRITSVGTTSYTWNDDGTLASRTQGGATVSFTWGYDQQLVGMSTGQSFAYDAGGRRVSRTAGGVTTTFCFDGSAVVLEKQGSTTVGAYTYGDNLLSRGSEVFHYDGHGSLRTVTDGGQAVTGTQNYGAYGEVAGGTGSSASPYRYGATSGYRNDGDNGLLHIGARWYDPAIGRWISADPYLGEVVRPLSRNRYLYCEADPQNHVDPTGYISQEALTGAMWGAAMAIGFAAIVVASGGTAMAPAAFFFFAGAAGGGLGGLIGGLHVPGATAMDVGMDMIEGAAIGSMLGGGFGLAWPGGTAPPPGRPGFAF